MQIVPSLTQVNIAHDDSIDVDEQLFDKAIQNIALIDDMLAGLARLFKEFRTTKEREELQLLLQEAEDKLQKLIDAEVERLQGLIRKSS